MSIQNFLINKSVLGAYVTLFFMSSVLISGAQSKDFKLADFFQDNIKLEDKTDSIFNTLSDYQRVGQMIVAPIGSLGRSEDYAKNLIEQNGIGGFVILKGNKKNHAELIGILTQLSRKKNFIPPLFSIDAEPSLFNGRMAGSFKLKNTIDLKSPEEADSIARLIATDIKSIGIHQNYAPVVDISPNNEAIKNRSFGSNPDRVIEMSKAFIKGTQESEAIATAKHFPGHGLVKGDTHKNSVFIDGELMEADNYRPLIQDGVLSVMIAHIEVRNNADYNTEGLPATCSPVIVKELLQNQLGFKGLIITDALNMEAAKVVEKPALKASMAGCDVLLMPEDEAGTIEDILNEMSVNTSYKSQVYTSVKKILRLKICLGLFD